MAPRTTAAKATARTTAKGGKAAGKPAAKANGKAKAATPTREPEWKTEVLAARVNEQVLQEELRARGLETRGATMVLVARLEKAICTSIVAPAQIVKCDDCRGRSSSESTRCPFCGSADPVELHAQPEAGEDGEEKAGEEPEASGDGADDEAEEAHEEPAPSGDDEPAHAEASGDGEPEEPPAPPVELHDEEPAPPSAPGGSSPSEPPSSGSLVLSSEDAAAAAASAGVQPSKDEVEDLDRRVSRVRELIVTFQVNGWDIGNELNQIHDSKAWLARRMPSGAPKYRRFGAFVETEFGNDKSWAHKFMAVARTFSREQVLARGISRMVLVVQVPEGIREKILANDAAMGAPVSDLKQITKLVKAGTDVPEAVASVAADKAARKAPAPAPVVHEEPDHEPSDDGDEGPGEGADGEERGASPAPSDAGKAPAPARHPERAPKAAPAGKPAAAKGKERDLLGATPRPEKMVNVITMPGRFQVKMYALGKANEGPLGKRRAFALNEHPRGYHVFDNGSELRIGVHQSPRGIFLVCEVTPPTAG